MTAETDLRELIGKIVRRMVNVENIAPRIRTVERGMHCGDGGAFDREAHREGGEPCPVFIG